MKFQNRPGIVPANSMVIHYSIRKVDTYNRSSLYEPASSKIRNTGFRSFFHVTTNKTHIFNLFWDTFLSIIAIKILIKLSVSLFDVNAQFHTFTATLEAWILIFKMAIICPFILTALSLNFVTSERTPNYMVSCRDWSAPWTFSLTSK